MTRETLIEKLAAIEHTRWAEWQRWVHSECRSNADGSLVIPATHVERWERQIRTPYADLSESEKESDREQVQRYLHLIDGLVDWGDPLNQEDVAEMDVTSIVEPATGRKDERDD